MKEEKDTEDAKLFKSDSLEIFNFDQTFDNRNKDLGKIDFK